MRHAGTFAVVTMMLAALPLYACAGSPDADGSDAGPTPTQDGGTTQSMTGAEVHANVRDGFVAEAEWMRSYGVAALEGGPDAQAAFARLSQAHAQIVQQVAPFSGDASAAELDQLLQTRANAFADLVASLNSKAASKSGDPQATLDANAQQISDFFVALCPNAFPGNASVHLESANRSMIAGFEARAANDHIKAVVDFDAAQVSNVQFADAVGVAISSTFNAELAPATTSRSEDALGQDLRLQFGDQAFWMRAFIVDQIQDVVVQPELDRSVQATVDMGKILSSYFGETAGTQAQIYIHEDTTNAIAFLYALQNLDQGAVEALSAKWNEDGDNFVLFLTRNVGVDQAAAQRLWRTNIDRERAMILARTNEQWDAESVNYQLVLESRTQFASLFAASIIAKFPPVR